MDFEYAPEQENFRKFRAWLERNLPPDLCVDDPADDRVASTREMFERRVAWQKTMHAAGWVGIAWPQEYGGRGASIIERVIWDEEYAKARAPVLPGMGLNLVGPTIIHWGTDAQKKQYLPKILNGARSGPRASPSPAPAPTWPGWAPAPTTRATTTCWSICDRPA